MTVPTFCDDCGKFRPCETCHGCGMRFCEGCRGDCAGCRMLERRDP